MTDLLTIDGAGGEVVERSPVPAVTSDAASLMSVITRAASDPAVDVDKLERLMSMYERITERQAKAEYMSALAMMQSELPEITERGEITVNKEVRSRYAKWEDINEAIKPVLHRHGFALSFRTGREADQVMVTAILSHRAGHYEETAMRLPLDTSGSKNNVQAVGSSTSYGQRYTAIALLNITSRGEDDDGWAGGAKSITDEQRELLTGLADAVGADKKKFCEFLGVSSFAEIPANHFVKAKLALESKARKAAQ